MYNNLFFLQLKGGKIAKKKVVEIMNEARVMRLLKHKHVVRCYGVAADTEPFMIVMELIDGVALDAYLKRQTAPIPLAQRVNMMYDAALGLECVHSKNILHRYVTGFRLQIQIETSLTYSNFRDIAARNCLYDSKVLKVSDFGLSFIGDKYNLTGTEKAPVRWYSPEVFRTHIYTRAADVWAFGVLVWVCRLQLLILIHYPCFQEIFHDAQEPYRGWTNTRVQVSVLESGNKLEMPDSAGPNMSKLFKDIFDVDPTTRISMTEIVKRIEKFAPK